MHWSSLYRHLEEKIKHFVNFFCFGLYFLCSFLESILNTGTNDYDGYTDFDDNQSIYTSTTMNGSETAGRKSGARGGKRKITSAPVGATIDLNV